MTCQAKTQIALVTGATTGPGKAVVEALRNNGLIVVTHDSNVDRALSDVQADLMDETSVVQMFDVIRSRYGKLDVLVTCHAEPAPGALLKGDSAAFWHQLDGTLTTSFLVVREAAALLAASGQGRVVLLSSGWSLGAPGLSGMASASAGIDLLTKALARELGPREITVNAIAPAFIDDDLWLACDAAALGISLEELRNSASQVVPAGVLGHSSALAQLATLLCQPALGAAIGQTVHCSGGYFRHRI